MKHRKKTSQPWKADKKRWGKYLKEKREQLEKELVIARLKAMSGKFMVSIG